ncbi:MAG: bifunctional riboflavin kinase/FAD synthetase [Alphaproteobacteria bacterium]|nr:bifunctional riboflavin kinase/FAD synthetase [Alphaproteobacteria bacterium]
MVRPSFQGNSKTVRIVHSIPFWPEAAQGSVIALGNFDGVHAGHQAVLSRARALANAKGVPLAVMAFEPHPRRFFNPALPVLRIVPFAEKARLLREIGVDYFYVAHFNAAFAALSADAFIQDILLDGLKVSHVVTGHNFAFGHKRQGDSAFLAQKSAELGFGYTQVDAAMNGDAVYSSSAVRHALSEGDVGAASAILGRPYAIRGLVIKGDQRGRTLGFPTANIRPSPLFLPKAGVYAVRVELDGEQMAGVANLGTRPTVDGTRRLLEVHLFDRNIDLYGRKLSVQLTDFIRAEKKFDGLDALKAQIAEDSATARRLLES